MALMSYSLLEQGMASLQKVSCAMRCGYLVFSMCSHVAV
jgi:hypothetical protein